MCTWTGRHVYVGGGERQGVVVVSLREVGQASWRMNKSFSIRTTTLTLYLFFEGGSVCVNRISGQWYFLPPGFVGVEETGMRGMEVEKGQRKR